MPPVLAPADRRRTLPPGAVTEAWTLPDGWPLRSMWWRGGERGSILFVGGRADFIEKYAEAYARWLDAGFGVATFDWRGQGGSGRLGSDPHRGHSADFGLWVDDLDALVARYAATMPGPYFAVAHSMGGHLLLRHLARGASPIGRAVLLAPMLGIRTGMPDGAARALARAGCALGLSGRYGPLQRPYGAWQRRPERRALLTSCADRFDDEHDWLARVPQLALGGVTYGWLAAAHRSIDALVALGVLESIATPLLVLVGERERLVDATAAERAATRLPHARFETVPHAAHELLREAEVVQDDVHARIAAFL